MLTNGLLSLQLKDPKLFIQDAFIDGQWVSRDKKFDVYG